MFVETTKGVHCSSPIKSLPQHQVQALIIWPKEHPVLPTQSCAGLRAWEDTGEGMCEGNEAQGMCGGTDQPLLPRGSLTHFRKVELKQRGNEVFSTKGLQWQSFSWRLKESCLIRAAESIEVEDISGGASFREG